MRWQNFFSAFLPMVGQHSANTPYRSFAPMCAVSMYFFIKSKKRSEEMILIRSFSRAVLGFAARVGAGVDLRVV